MVAEERKKSPSFEETDWDAQNAADNREIAKLLEQSQDGSGGLKLDDTPFDQANKADDAEDFEDISDDDLPEEMPSAGTSLEMPGLTDDGGTSNDADDLFGEGPSSPDPVLGAPSPGAQVREDADGGEETQPTDASMSFPGINFDPEPSMNHADNQDPDIPEAAETAEDVVKATWPAFMKGRILTWSEILPPKKSVWKEKKPAKRPKRLVMSKMNLELEADQSATFRLPGPQASEHKYDTSSSLMVRCDWVPSDEREDTTQFNIDQTSDSETVMGFSLRDIEMACEDWGTQIHDIESNFTSWQKAELEKSSRKRPTTDAEKDDEWDAEFLLDGEEAPKPQVKKRRPIPKGLPEIPRYTAPSFDDFQEATRRGAKRVHLDMSDPHLLIESQDSSRGNKRSRQDGRDSKRAIGKLGRDIASRFNLSNDEAYDLLKENHQSKVRATLGNISVEHGMPAVKLTWPYYKVKLPGTTDEYHRPRFRYKKFAGHTIRFEKPLSHKRKHMKGKAPEVFTSSKDLSINDNSSAILFEYCEPRPRVLNNFAMGSRLINYYRRKDAKDEEQLPKQELGEYRFLLPEDRSPFSLFGTVDPGETVPTLHNEMYRAPVFKHTPRNTDFLMVRSTTGAEGSKWYLHKIDHLHVVGQTFPSVEVPGPHSRKVTNASKNRMKMLAFRMIRHSGTDNCQLSDITYHIAESTDTQNRQKLKEFLQYDRDSRERGMWRLRPGEILPDESAVRAMVKPEEVCLLDAMQLGIKELEDAGYDPRNANIEDDAQLADADGDDGDDDDEGSKVGKPGAKKAAEKQEETLADKMAPWKTTKAFIDACAQKAMLQLHGEGDPTGHGLGFSFIRTSMKGGYIEAVQGPLATSADAMEREKRANGGHAYNVKKQQAMYEEGIREIWEKQKTTLSDGQEHDDKDVAATEDEDERFNVNSAATPAQFDDGTSQISGFTSSSRHAKRAIRINREVRMADGTTQTRTEVVHDPVVISQYMKRRTEADLELKDIYSSRPTGNADHDRLAGLRIKKELERLEKNKARRQAREQQKEMHNKAHGIPAGAGDAGSPGSTAGAGGATPASAGGAANAPSVDKIATGTTRKCANCGQPFDWWSAAYSTPTKSKSQSLFSAATQVGGDEAEDYDGYDTLHEQSQEQQSQEQQQAQQKPKRSKKRRQPAFVLALQEAERAAKRRSRQQAQTQAEQERQEAREAREERKKQAEQQRQEAREARKLAAQEAEQRRLEARERAREARARAQEERHRAAEERRQQRQAKWEAGAEQRARRTGRSRDEDEMIDLSDRFKDEITDYLAARQLQARLEGLCPLLNGTMSSDNGAAEHGGFGSYNAPAGSP